MGRQLNIIYETDLRNFHYCLFSLIEIRFIAQQFFCLLLKKYHLLDSIFAEKVVYLHSERIY